jgi:hypothetical protein
MQDTPTRQIEKTILHERRRPGRQKSHYPALVKLLRRKFDAVPSVDEATADDPDNLAAAKGIMVSVGAAMLLWVLLIGGGWLMWRLLT